MFKSAYLPVEDFANAIFPHDVHSRILVMMTAYFDASRTQDGRPFVTLAGGLSTTEKWGKFESEWRELLNDEGLDFFHMPDFESYKGIYKNWTRKRHEDVFTRISKIVRPWTTFAFGRGVSDDDFEFAKTQREVLLPWSAFTYCTIGCFHAIAVWANNQGINDAVAYVFSSGDGYNKELYALKDQIESSPERMLRFKWAGMHIMPRLSLNPPYPLLPLQAADVWAFEARKEYENKYAHGGEERKRPLRKSTQLLLRRDKESVDFGFFKREHLLAEAEYLITA